MPIIQLLFVVGAVVIFFVLGNALGWKVFLTMLAVGIGGGLVSYWLFGRSGLILYSSAIILLLVVSDQSTFSGVLRGDDDSDAGS